MNSCLLQQWWKLWILLWCPGEEMPMSTNGAALGTALKVRCEPSPTLTAGAVLAAHSLPILEQTLELINFLWQPSSKFVSWKCRMSSTLLPFLIPISRWLDSAVTSIWILCGFRQNSSCCSRWNCHADGGSTNHCGRLRTSKAKSSGVCTENELLTWEILCLLFWGSVLCFPKDLAADPGWHSWDRKVLPEVFWERQCKSLFHLSASQWGIVLFSCWLIILFCNWHCSCVLQCLLPANGRQPMVTDTARGPGTELSEILGIP